jgi:short-subunit dehydrogenase
VSAAAAGRGAAAVTGASAGIGRAFAERLAARGYDLIVIARDRERLEALAAGLRAAHGVRVDVEPADLSRDDEVDRLVALLRGRADLALLVNNAGFGTGGTLATADPDGQARMVRVHVLAAMRLAQAALAPMLARGRGGIVNVASVAGFMHSVGNVNYTATKAYLINFSQGLAAELHGTGVRVQALCPGFTHSEFHARFGFDKGEIPRALWMDAERVVRESLAALERGGPVVYVPGKRYRAIVALLRVVPDRLLAWIGRRGHRSVLRGAGRRTPAER